MKLHISQKTENNQNYVKIERSKDFSNNIWQTIKISIREFQESDFNEETNNFFCKKKQY